jgi:hypothetical protein
LEETHLAASSLFPTFAFCFSSRDLEGPIPFLRMRLATNIQTAAAVVDSSRDAERRSGKPATKFEILLMR